MANEPHTFAMSADGEYFCVDGKWYNITGHFRGWLDKEHYGQPTTLVAHYNEPVEAPQCGASTKEYKVVPFNAPHRFEVIVKGKYLLYVL